MVLLLRFVWANSWQYYRYIFRTLYSWWHCSYISYAMSMAIWSLSPFERQKIEVHIFERANLSCFGTWKFTAKENLNRQKQVFFLNFRPWPAQKPNIWSIFYGRKLILENSLVWKLGAFCLKIGTFPRLLVVASYPCRIGTLSHLLWSSGWHVTSHIWGVA